MGLAQLPGLDAQRLPVHHPPAPRHHHPVGPVGAAQDQCRQRVVGAGKAEFVKGEQGEIGLAALLDPADIPFGRGTRPSPPSPSAGRRDG